MAKLNQIEQGLIDKATAALQRWGSARDRVKAADEAAAAARAEQEMAGNDYNAVISAAAVFDIVLDDLLDKYWASIGSDNTTADSPPTLLLAIPGAEARPVREAVLALAEAAYPRPVFAAEMRAELEKQRGSTLHEKTIGMTLYRLSKDGLMRREGQKNWFFVPPEQRTKNPAVGAAGQEDFGL